MTVHVPDAGAREGGGFGFLEEPFGHEAAETPTLRSSGERGPGGAPRGVLRSPSSRRRAVGFDDGSGPDGSGRQAFGAARQVSFSSRRLSGASDTPSMHSPGSDVQGVGGLGGPSYASGRSLSQAALNEMAERWVGRLKGADARAGGGRCRECVRVWGPQYALHSARPAAGLAPLRTTPLSRVLQP